MGLIAHTCLEATVRDAAELGYQVTVVKNATASYRSPLVHSSTGANVHAAFPVLFRSCLTIGTFQTPAPVRFM
jgi:nicotinamidase-related amidase